MNPSVHRIFTGLSLTALLGGVVAHAQDDPGDVTLIIADRIFDGERWHEGGAIRIADGVIAEVLEADPLDVGEDESVVRGAVLLPGLFDAHVHVFGDALATAIRFGVTTELDMFTSPELAKQLRGNDDPTLADLRSAGILATAPNGHGTQFGIPVPTLTDVDDAGPFVEARIAEGSDYIKLVYDGGDGWGGRIPTLSREVLAAVITAAHEHGKMAVVHVHDLEHAREAIEAGADGLVHVFIDKRPDDAFVALMQERGAFVVPTLAVIEGLCGRTGGADLIDDPALTPFLRSADRAALKRTFQGGLSRPDYAVPRDAVRILHDAGIPILAGSDAPNPGTLHGASLHRELELLVEAGLSVTDALAAATSIPADRFDLADRGRIAVGKRADLLLLSSDPTDDIHATRSIQAIWKAGVPVARAQAEESTSSGAVIGLVSDFEDDGLDARFGAGWVETTDSIARGKSTVSIERVEGGADDSAGALAVEGEIQGGFAFPWAGAMFQPGAEPMVGVDLSSASGVTFQARGDGGTYRCMLLGGAGGIPATATFEAGDEWTAVTVRFAAMQPAPDLESVAGIIFCGGPALGEFRFEIDDVALVK